MERRIKNTHIPKLSNIETAVRLYHTTVALYTEDILELFPGIGKSSITRLKNMAREQSDAVGHFQMNSRGVNTKDAYDAWGLNIDELEKKYGKLKKLELLRVTA